MSGFACTQCGLCCRQVGAVIKNKVFVNNPQIRSALDLFPYEVDANGVCEKLIDNRCSVYDDRPLICRVEDMAVVNNLNKEDWYRASAEACNHMIRQAGLDDSYLIKDYDRIQ